VGVLQTLADAYRELDELPQSWHVYQRMGAIVRKNNGQVERPVLVAYYRRLAGLELELGDVEEAVKALHAGLDAAHQEPRLVLQRAYLVATLAQVSARTDATTSRAQFAQARRLFESRLPESHPAILRVINESCALEVRVGTPPVDCREALQRLTGGSEVQPALRAAVYENLSQLSQRDGHLFAAAQYADSAVAAAEGLGTPGVLWRAYFRTAEVLHARGESALAIFFGKRAIAAIESERRQFTGEDERFDSGFLRNKTDVYRRVADWLLDAGRIDEAIEVMRLLKAHELDEFVARAARPRGLSPGPELDPAEQALQRSYSSILPGRGAVGLEIQTLSGMQDKGRITGAERRRLAVLARAQRRQEIVTARRIRRFLERHRNWQVASVPVRRLQAAVLQQDIKRAAAHSAIVYYLLTGHRLRILIATASSLKDISVPVDEPQLQRTIGAFLDEITQRQDSSATARALYATLAKPVDESARQAGITRLYLWLDGALRYVPFAALRAPDGYLGERYAIERVAHGRASAASAPGASTEPLIVRGFGVTRAVDGFPALPAVADELCYIVRGPIAGLAAAASPACSLPPDRRGALAGEGFADAAFTAQRLESLLQHPHGFSVLHLGTHFSLRPGNVDRSFLVLGDGSRLTLSELSTLDFSGLDLVTLSACQTAVGGGRTDDGREVEGLSALVQERGARHVVASLWQVDDVSTAELMRAMYDRLESPSAAVAVALQQAQRTVRDFAVKGRHPYAQPYYWAGFVISGQFR
jgi:CHAT domain-containing protein/tetratricopeptide (TPR) repeat protein